MLCVYPFQPHAKCCSLWICFMGCLGGVQWVGLTHISQVFLHTIKSVPVQLWANKMRWNVISVEQGKLRWLQTVAAALPLVWMALDLIEVFRCLTEHWANFFFYKFELKTRNCFVETHRFDIYASLFLVWTIQKVRERLNIWSSSEGVC